jgi:hypothetical protein
MARPAGAAAAAPGVPEAASGDDSSSGRTAAAQKQPRAPPPGLDTQAEGLAAAIQALQQPSVSPPAISISLIRAVSDAGGDGAAGGPGRR